MRIALVHDYLKEYGGAERVLMTLHEMWPEAPIYTAFCDRNSTAGREFSKAKVIESVFAPLIKHKNLYSPLRFLAPLIWKSFDLSKYDLVISSASWYITRGFRVSPKTKVICYCHTPPRYLYGYPTSIEWQRYFLVRIYALVVNHFLRMYDYSSAQKPASPGQSGVDTFIANSKNVASRIKKFYRRDSTVIYPPVEVEKIGKVTAGLKPENYYLIASRIVGAKGVEMATAAAKKARFHLKIVGEPAGLRWFGKGLDALKNEWVEFTGRIPDEELYKCYGKCKAFLALATDEDFGVTPVEAMAAGRPVIAFRGGGYLETVIDGKTGVFFDKPTIESLTDAIRRFERLNNKTITAVECRRQARKFSKEKFVREIKEFVTSRIDK